MTSEIKKLLDPTGWRLLEVLQSDARLSFSEIGRRVGLSTPAVIERIRKMEEAELITGFSVQLNYEKLGFPITAFIRLETHPDVHANLQAKLQEAPEVLQCYYITGRASFILKVVVSSVSHLEKLIEKLAVYGQTYTSIVMSMPVQNKPLTPPSNL